jgi:hypothetical protein
MFFQIESHTWPRISELGSDHVTWDRQAQDRQAQAAHAAHIVQTREM